MDCVCDEGTLYSGGETIPCFYCGIPEYRDMFDKLIGVGKFLVFPLNNTLRIGLLIKYLPHDSLKLVYYDGNTKHTTEVKSSQIIVISEQQFLCTYESKRLLNLYKKSKLKEEDVD